MTSLPIPITAVFTGILAIMLVGISIRVTRARITKKVSFHDGGDKEMTGIVRAQGNFIEYVPMALLVMALIEAMGGRIWAVYLYGGLLLVARLAHVFALYSGFFPARVIGTSVTWALLALGGLYVIGLAA